MDRLKSWIPLLVCAVAAVFVLFPLSVYPSLFHRTPNTPLHLMVLDHLAIFAMGDPSSAGPLGVPLQMSHVVAADFPSGRPVRIIGWPFQLLAMPLVPVVGRVVALNVALLVSLIASGWLMVKLLATMGMRRSTQTLGGLAWVMNPLMVSFLANGQYENHVGWAVPLALIGLMRGGVRGHVMLALGLLGAAFSSPYQAVPAAVVVVSVIWLHKQRQMGLLLATLGGVFALCYAYYSGPQPTPGGECGPTSGTMPLVVSELFGFTGRLRAEMPFQVDRWTSFQTAFAQPVIWSRDLDLHNLVVSPGSAFLGLLPLAGGLIGLWRIRMQPWAKPLALAGLGCFLLALGPDLSLVRGESISMPLPGDLLGWLPGISQMGTTLRFTTGLAFVLVLGLCFLAEDIARSTGRVAILMALVLADWVFGTVSPVPMAARSYQLPTGFSAVPEQGAVMTVPVRERVSPEAHLWMGAVLERSVVGYCDRPISSYREQYGLVDYAQGGVPPDRTTIQRDFHALSQEGIGYLAFMVVEPGEAQFKRVAGQIQALLGPADSVGDGIIGYRTLRPKD